MSKSKINKNTKKYQLKLEKRFKNKQFKLWGIGVKNRDENKCVICGNQRMVNSHHIIPREVHCLRFDIMNGISLCQNHHKYSYQISAHKNSFKFYEWLIKNRPEQFKYLSEYPIQANEEVKKVEEAKKVEDEHDKQNS